MSKQRTKKQKLTARHIALANLYQKYEPKISLVKGEFKYQVGKRGPEAKKQKKGLFLAQESDEKVIRREIVKSLSLAAFILSLEIVLYLAWK